MTAETPPFRVLLVEDDDDHAALAEFHLRQADSSIRLERIDNVPDALNRVSSWGDGAHPPPHLVLLDLKLQSGSGLEVLEAVRAVPALAPVRVVVLSTSDSPADKRAAYEQQASSYLVKPTGHQQYRDLMSQVLLYWQSCNRMPEAS